MTLPGAQSLFAAALFFIAIGARITVSNGHIRSRLTASALAFAYDSYVGGVYRLLASGADCEQVAERLAELSSSNAVPLP